MEDVASSSLWDGKPSMCMGYILGRFLRMGVLPQSVNRVLVSEGCTIPVLGTGVRVFSFTT